MSNKKSWTAVDDYIVASLFEPDPSLIPFWRPTTIRACRRSTSRRPRASCLHLLARIGARRILEIGTLGGYWTIWLARALPRGRRLVTLEAEAHTPRSPAPNSPAPASPTGSSCASARRSTRCPSSREAARSTSSSSTPTSRSNPDYFAWALQLTRPGTRDRRRQRRPRRPRHRRRQRDPDVIGTRRFIELSPPSRGSSARRSRPSAARATTASPFAIVD